MLACVIRQSYNRVGFKAARNVAISELVLSFGTLATTTNWADWNTRKKFIYSILLCSRKSYLTLISSDFQLDYDPVVRAPPSCACECLQKSCDSESRYYSTFPAANTTTTAAK